MKPVLRSDSCAAHFFTALLISWLVDLLPPSPSHFFFNILPAVCTFYN